MKSLVIHIVIYLLLLITAGVVIYSCFFKKPGPTGPTGMTISIQGDTGPTGATGSPAGSDTPGPTGPTGPTGTYVTSNALVSSLGLQNNINVLDKFSGVINFDQIVRSGIGVTLNYKEKTGHFTLNQSGSYLISYGVELGLTSQPIGFQGKFSTIFSQNFSPTQGSIEDYSMGDSCPTTIVSGNIIVPVIIKEGDDLYIGYSFSPIDTPLVAMSITTNSYINIILLDSGTE